eukprot:1417102-Pyramimonas_sp.AAC.1
MAPNSASSRAPSGHDASPSHGAVRRYRALLGAIGPDMSTSQHCWALFGADRRYIEVEIHRYI